MNFRSFVGFLRIPLLSTLAILLTLSGILFAQDQPPVPDRILPPVQGLVAVAFPDLKDIEVDVAKQITTSQEKLRQATSQKGTTRKSLSDAYAEAAMLYHAYSMFQSAGQSYTNAALLMSKDFRWRHMLGIVMIELNDNYGAIDQFKLAIKLNPKSVPSKVRLGNAFAGLNLMGLAQNAYESALALSPNEPSALLGLGEVEYAAKRFKKAALHFKNVLALVPEANRVEYSIAMSYRNLGDVEKAKEHLAKRGKVGIGIRDPLLSQVLHMRQGNRLAIQDAKSAFEAGRLDDAIALYEKVLADDPNNIPALINSGAAYSSLKKHEEAAARFKKAISLQPANTNAHYNFAVVSSILNQSQNAIDSFRVIIKLTPKDINARIRLARELRKAGQYEESLNEFRIASDSKMEDENLLIELIKYLSSRGKHREVLKTAREFLFNLPDPSVDSRILCFRTRQVPGQRNPGW